MTSPQGSRVHLPVTCFLFRDTTFRLALALFASLRPKYGTLYRFTSASPKHELLPGVILRRNTLSQPLPSPSSPIMCPDSLLKLWRYINPLLTYLRTYHPFAQTGGSQPPVKTCIANCGLTVPDTTVVCTDSPLIYPTVPSSTLRGTTSQNMVVKN